MKGTYILVIKLSQNCIIIIGALGPISFPKGLYFYVGSAMATTGALTLLNRVKRHLLNDSRKKLHWHIDYLLKSNYAQISKVFLIPSEEKYECIIAREILKKSDDYINNFGSSDCSCKSHLFYINRLSSFELSDIIGD
ncbi:MAG: GIY-YIG nuclease family protein [Promethearchaeota archaeon]|nr:MAG: GIY-YIG nuclease family protein [Candidatus Lokiarchaeota archaeon]